MTKKLTKVAMTTALAAAAIVPAVVATPAQAAEAEVTFAKAYYSTANGTAAFEAGKLAGVISATTDTGITHLEASNGEVFTMQAFSAYLAVNPTATTDQVLTALSKASKALSADQVKALNVKEGKVEGGKVTVDADAPVADVKVESVKAINATQVEVKFNKELDATTAENAAMYKINTVALADGTTAAQTPAQATAELQADNKTVVLTLADIKTNNTAFTFQVDGVKDKSGTAVKSENFTVTVKDEAAPTITKTEIAPSGDLKITFSEPLSAVNPIVRVNGTPVTVTNVVAGNTVVTVPAANLPAIAKGATATLYVAGAKDTATNEMSIFNGSVVKPNDSTAPTVTSATQIGQNEVRFVFNKPLGTSAADLTAADIKLLKGSTVYSNGTASTVIAVTKNTTVDPNGKTYDVTFDLGGAGTPDYGIYATGSDTQQVTLLMDKDAVKDAFGNGIASYSQVFTFNKDTKGPKFVSAKTATNKQTIEVAFDEKFVDGAGNIDEGKIIITNADGVRFSAIDASTVAKGASNGDEKVLLVDFVAGATAITNGTYTLQFQKGAVKDAYNNLSDAFSTTVTVGDSADTAKPVATLDGASGENKFVVAYDKEVSASALDKGNYKLDGAALPAGTVTYFTDTNKNKVAIELPAGSVNIGKVGTGTNGLLNVSNVSDKAGNVVASTNLTVKLADNTSATLNTVQVLGNDIVLTFSEAIDPVTATAINDIAKVAADFEIKVGGDLLNLGTQDSTATGGTNPAATVATVPGSDKQLKISLTPVVQGTGGVVAGDGTASNWNPASTVTVKVKGNTLKDANLFLLKEGSPVSK